MSNKEMRLLDFRTAKRVGPSISCSRMARRTTPGLLRLPAAAATSSAHGLGGHRQDGGRPRARREGFVTALAVLELAGLQCWHDGVDGRSQVEHGGLEGELHGCYCCSSTGDIGPIAMVSPAAHIAAIPSR